MTDKPIIKTFSDGYCLVLHENRVSLRENNYTKYQIVVGAKTNELFEFVKELYLDNKAKEQECEELKRELQAQRDFTSHEQKLIYCVAYDDSCKTGNDCKQKKCIFKDNIKLLQTLIDIKEIAEKSCCLQPTSTCEEYENCNECSRTSDDVTVKQILQKISEVEDEN